MKDKDQQLLWEAMYGDAGPGGHHGGESHEQHYEVRAQEVQDVYQKHKKHTNNPQQLRDMMWDDLETGDENEDILTDQLIDKLFHELGIDHEPEMDSAEDYQQYLQGKEETSRRNER